MVQFNFSERTIKAKVVYYGPAQSGKTTNLEQIHRLTDPAGVNQLISLNTAQDRTLFFDLLPFSLGAVAGYDFKIQLYTVPGQVQYNATRRVVLAGADAVVFVVDSRASMLKENVTAFENMKVNLLANRLIPEKVPLVMQFNKQDLPDLLPEAELQKVLNVWGRPSFPAMAATGKGVLETFLSVIQEMLSSIAVRYNLKEKGLDPSAVPAIVSEAFGAIMTQAGAQVPRQAPHTARLVVSQPTDAPHAAPAPASPETGLVSEELLHRAIRSNVELAEALSGLAREMNLGLAAILSHAELLLIYRDDARGKRSAAINSIQQEALRLRRMIHGLGQAAQAPAAAPPSTPFAPGPVAVPRPDTKTSPPALKPPATAAALPPSPPRPVPTVPPAKAGFEGLVQEVVSRLRPVFDSRGLAVHVQISAGTPPPASPPAELQRALTGFFEGVATASPPRGAISVRCERKPVLVRTKDAESRRDFLMLALAQQGGPSTEQQELVLKGDPSAMKGAGRIVRELGGFVRFAPLPGGLETRVFLPAP